jgi:hypothetical protein
MVNGKSVENDCSSTLEELEEDFIVVRDDGKYRVFSKAFEMYVSNILQPK